MSNDSLTDEDAKAIVVAARRYRDTMRWYLAERERVLDDRAVVDDLVTCIWTPFREAMGAERDLFDLIDALDVSTSHHI